MEKHACKLCNRQFSNGRALGGHMRSHVVAAASAAAKTLLSDDSSSWTSLRDAEGTEAMEEGKGLGYDLRENPRKSYRMADPEFSSVFAGSSVVQDLESETESSPRASAIHRRRNKLARRSAVLPPPPEVHDPEPLSSVSDAMPEEDVALSLMMLSRDVWTKEEQEAEEQNFDLYAEEEIQRRAATSGKPSKLAALGCGRFQCGTCKKVFRSYQALGGHRASHKKSRGCAPQGKPSELQVQDGNCLEANAEENKVHECPVCFRVFGSGQALGGHKRSHLSSSSTVITFIPQPPPNSIRAKFDGRMFDLNLPAPMDENGELSAVSNSDSPPQQLMLTNKSEKR